MSILDTFTGVLMLCFAGVVCLFFRPRFKSSRAICTMTGAMGLMTLTTQEGNQWVQLILILMQMIMAVCFAKQILRESRLRARRTARNAVFHKARPHRQTKNCA